MAKLWLLFAFLLVGCGPQIHVYVGEDESERLIEAVADAVDFWNERIGADVLALHVTSALDTRTSYGPDSIVVVSQKKVVAKDSHAYTFSAGLFTRTAVENSAIRDPEIDLRWLLAHELGHALGLTHVHERDNIMFAQPWWGEASMATTAQQRRRVRSLTALRMAVLL